MHILPRGNTPEDMGPQIILKTLDGERTWNPKHDLITSLKKNLESEINNLVNSQSHRREMAFPDKEDGTNSQDKIEQQAVENGILGMTRPLSPETLIIQQEEVQEKANAAYEAVSGEPELEQLLEAIIDSGGETRPRYLAEWIGTSVKDINNRKKRFLNRMIAIREEYNEKKKTS